MYNSTSQNCKLVLGEIKTWNFIVYILIALTGAVANVLLLLAIVKDPLKCFRNPMSWFIANLAFSDLLNALLNVEELCVALTSYESMLCLPGVTPIRINISVYIFVFALTFPSVFSLALERYFAIARPLWHKVHISPRVCRIWIALLWLVNLVYVGFHIQFTKFPSSWPLLFSTSLPMFQFEDSAWH